MADRLQQTINVGPTQFVLFRQVPNPGAGGTLDTGLGSLILGQFRGRAEAHTLGPGPRDSLRLALFLEMRFELGDRSQDPEYKFAGRGRGVDGLVLHDEPDVVFLQLLKDSVQVEG